MNCFRQYSAKGITSVGSRGRKPVFVPADAGVARCREIRSASASCSTAESFDQFKAAGIERGFGDDRLRITAIKNFQGNSLSGRTAWLSEAYSDRPGYFGIPPARTQEQLDADFQKWWDAGWQVATHSNGDREIDMVLTAIEHAEAKNPASGCALAD